MAKIRVYELARELNLNNKALLEKLRAMDISVGSHMSSLDTDTVAIVKQGLVGKKVEPEVVSTRVKPTVIRRRKKVVKKKAEPEDIPASETPETQEEAEPVETKPVVDEEKVAVEETAPSADEKPVEKDTAPVEDTVVSEAPPVEIPAQEAKTSTEEAEKPEKEAEAEDKAAMQLPEKEEKKPAKKVAKKKKRSGAAKIIKLPEKPPEIPVKPKKKALDKKPAASRPRPSGVERPEPAVIKESKKKKGKRSGEKDSQEKRLFRKKSTFRRKEIVEGSALYDGKRIKGRKGRKGAAVRSANQQKTLVTVPKAIKRKVKIDDTIVLAELAKRMGIKAGEMIRKLMDLGVMATVNQTIDFDTAVLVATEFEYEVERATFEEETLIKKVDDDPENLVARPPVVTIMGHVDHGKTSLLDVIRKTHITDDEAGGITQHIGAYNVATEKGQIAFLDTPGHEAFTAMRSRGAKITDTVVLVVAADDGVMPQTIEAINHSRAAEVPIVVAVNKMDKADADPDRVKRELSEHGILSEEWGGDTIFVNVSAKEKTGIDDLLDMILLQSEVLELKANPDKLASGHVVESKLDAGRGPVATVLVQDGTLSVGESVVCGVHYGKIRAMLGDTGSPVQSAGPSVPVEILGLTGVPEAGDELIALKDEKNAKQISHHRLQKQRSMELAKTSRLSLDKLFENMKDGEVKDLNLILKADVHGSIEAIKDALTKLSNEEVKINIVHSATGTVTESDISLAAVSEAIIIGFNVRPSAKVAELAKEENIDMRFYNIIYNLIKDIKDAIVGLMSSTFEERTLGMAEVREVFQIPKVGAIAGCYVTDGLIQRSQMVRLVRDGVVTYEGRIDSLRRFKDDVKEVQGGYECGIGIEKYNDIKVGDVIECFTLDEIKPELE